MCQRGSLVNCRCLRVSDERVGHEGKVSDGKQQQAFEVGLQIKISVYFIIVKLNLYV